MRKSRGLSLWNPVKDVTLRAVVLLLDAYQADIINSLSGDASAEAMIHDSISLPKLSVHGSHDDS